MDKAIYCNVLLLAEPKIWGAKLGPQLSPTGGGIVGVDRGEWDAFFSVCLMFIFGALLEFAVVTYMASRDFVKSRLHTSTH